MARLQWAGQSPGKRLCSKAQKTGFVHLSKIIATAESDIICHSPICDSLICTLNKHSEAFLIRFNYNCRQACLLHISQKSLDISMILFHCYGFHDKPTDTEFFASFQMLREQVRESSHVCIVYSQRCAHQLYRQVGAYVQLCRTIVLTKTLKYKSNANKYLFVTLDGLIWNVMKSHDFFRPKKKQIFFFPLCLIKDA